MTGGRSDITPILERWRCAAAAIGRPVRFMEVCGTHTMSAFRSGLHSLMPTNVTLLSGPGCPVCVTAQSEIDQCIELACRPGVILCTYGDMLRVPGSPPVLGSLERARSQGADVRVIYSALDAVSLARANPHRQVVFAAVGFETTAPATAAAILRAQFLGLNNFTVLASHKLVVPAIRALLDGGQVNLDGFLCPGHVSVVIGAEAYRPIVERYHQSCVIAGFEAAQMAEALVRLTELTRHGKPELVNLYPEAVTLHGNQVAQRLLAQVFEPADARWRGLGTIPQSGLTLRNEFQRFDARAQFGLSEAAETEIPGCLCGQVITGRASPADCGLFGRSCTPVHPIGPCMVSSEGTCQAWFKYHRPDSRQGALVTPATQEERGD